MSWCPRQVGVAVSPGTGVTSEGGIGDIAGGRRGDEDGRDGGKGWGLGTRWWWPGWGSFVGRGGDWAGGPWAQDGGTGSGTVGWWPPIETGSFIGCLFISPAPAAPPEHPALSCASQILQIPPKSLWDRGGGGVYGDGPPNPLPTRPTSGLRGTLVVLDVVPPKIPPKPW